MAHDQNDSDTSGGSDRRTFLKTVGLAATVAGGSAAFGGTGSARTVVDLGEQGLQNGELIDPYLDQYFNSGTEVHIPAGEYDFDGSGLGYKMSDAALIGSPEGVVFNRPSDPEQTVRPNVHATGGTVRIENITYRGKDGVAQSRWRVGAAEGARMELVNVNFPDGSVDNSDSTGIYTGTDHAGELYIKRCYVEGFGNVAMYLSDPYVGENGRVVVEDCVLRNTNASMIRFAPDNSVIRGCYFEATEQPPSEQGYGTVLRAIKFDDAGDDVVVEDCDFYWSDLGHTIIDLHERGAGGSGVVRNCRIHNDSDSAIVDFDWDAAGNWTGENIHVTGDGYTGLPSGFEAVTGDAAQSPDTNFAVWTPADGSDGGASGSTETETATGDGSTETQTETATDDGTDLPNTVTVSGGSASNVIDYSLEVSEALGATDTVNDEDAIDGTTATGAIAGGSDSYAFAGELTAFDASGDVTLTVNGETVDPSQVGSSSSTQDGSDGSTDDGSSGSEEQLPNTITLAGGSPTNLVEYEVTVSEGLAEHEGITGEDAIDGTTARGGLAGGADSYAFAGEVTDLTTTGDVSVTVNGESVDPGQFGASSSSDEATLSNTVTVSGGSASNVIDYSLEVSEALGATDTVNDEDAIDGTTATGAIAGGSDSYAFAGELTAFDASGDVTLTVNGETVDPSQVGASTSTDGSGDGSGDGTQESVVVIDGTGDADETARYLIEVSGTLTRDEERTRLETQATPWDSLQDNVESDRVVGIVGNGVDAYRFTGSITTRDVRGEASVEIIDE